jgi:hypothetical protein
MHKAIQELNKNQKIPFTIIDNGEGYLKLAKNKNNGEVLPLKDVIIDEQNNQARLIPYNPEEAIIKMWDYLDKQRLIRIEQKEVDKQKLKDGKKRYDKVMVLYEFVRSEDGAKFKAARQSDGKIFPFLWNGAPPEEMVLAAASYKKLIPILSNFIAVFKKNPILGLIRLVTLSKMIPDLIEFVHAGLYKYFMKRDGYTTAIRGLYDLFGNIENELAGLWKELIGKVKRIVCFYMEYDYAYRYRTQDILPLADKSKFKEKTKGKKFLIILCFLFPFIKKRYWNENLWQDHIGEIFRLFNVMIDRDYDEMKIKWRRLRDIVCLILEFNPALSEGVRQGILKTNLDKIRFSEADIFWVSFQPSYWFLGKPQYEREKERIKKYGM